MMVVMVTSPPEETGREVIVTVAGVMIRNRGRCLRSYPESRVPAADICRRTRRGRSRQIRRRRLAPGRPFLIILGRANPLAAVAVGATDAARPAIGVVDVQVRADTTAKRIPPSALAAFP